MEKINWQELIDRHIEANTENRDLLPQNEFRASQVNGCLRQAVLSKLNLKEYDILAKRRFFIGTAFHNILEKEIVSRIGGMEIEKDVTLDIEDIRIKGHIDCYDGENIYDFKTTKNIAFATRFPTPIQYTYQLSAYARGIEQITGKLPGAHLVYIDKNDLVVLSKSVTILENSEIYEFCYKVISAIEDYYATKKLPSKCMCLGCRYE